MTAEALRRRLEKLERINELSNSYYSAEFFDLETGVQSCLWVRVLPSGRRVAVEVPDEVSEEEWQREVDRCAVSTVPPTTQINPPDRDR